MKNILVLGIGFPNKGAELMLATIQQWSEDLPVDTRLLVPVVTPLEKRRQYGLWVTAPTKTLRKHKLLSRSGLAGLLEFFPASILRFGRYVKLKDVDLVLDASGFCYGDDWGARKAEDRLGSSIALLKKQGTKVVLLPQAFGPFSDPGLATTMDQIVAHADLVFARDTISASALRDVVGRPEKVHLAPDMTCLASGREFEGIDDLNGAIGIIPNHKMFEMGSTNSESGYLSYLVGVCQGLQDNGKKVVLLLHEGAKDRDICDRVNAELRTPVPVIERDDPLEIKEAIGRFDTLLTSRFHGFASALFQGVPAFSTSWSHKYAELARDFGVEDFVQANLDASKTVRQMILLLENGNRESEIQRVLTETGMMKTQARATFEKVEKLIFNGAGVSKK